jgi:hypothetical protein
MGIHRIERQRRRRSLANEGAMECTALATPSGSAGKSCGKRMRGRGRGKHDNDQQDHRIADARRMPPVFAEGRNGDCLSASMTDPLGSSHGASPYLALIEVLAAFDGYMRPASLNSIGAPLTKPFANSPNHGASRLGDWRRRRRLVHSNTTSPDRTRHERVGADPIHNFGERAIGEMLPCRQQVASVASTMNTTSSVKTKAALYAVDK